MPKFAVDSKEFDRLDGAHSVILFGTHDMAPDAPVVLQSAVGAEPQNRHLLLEQCAIARHSTIAELDLDDLHCSGWTEEHAESFIEKVEESHPDLVEEVMKQSYDAGASEEHTALLLKWMMDGRKTEGFNTPVTVIDFATCRNIDKHEAASVLSTETPEAQRSFGF